MWTHEFCHFPSKPPGFLPHSAASCEVANTKSRLWLSLHVRLWSLGQGVWRVGLQKFTADVHEARHPSHGCAYKRLGTNVQCAGSPMADSSFKFSIPHQDIFSMELRNKKLKPKGRVRAKDLSTVELPDIPLSFFWQLLTCSQTPLGFFPPNNTVSLPTSLFGFPCPARVSHITGACHHCLWLTLMVTVSYGGHFETAHSEQCNTS